MSFALTAEGAEDKGDSRKDENTEASIGRPFCDLKPMSKDAMKILSYLKSRIWPLRVKLSRLFCRYDRVRADVLQTQLDVRCAEERVLRAQLCATNDQLVASEERARLLQIHMQELDREIAAGAYWEQALEFIHDIKETPSWRLAATFANVMVDRVIRPLHRTTSWGDRLLSMDKAMGLASEPAFQEAFATFRGQHAYDQYNGPESIFWRLNTLVWAAREATGLAGDFVECGVFKGDMSYTVAKCLDFERLPKTFYLYDSFEGYSPKYSSQADFPNNPDFLEVANKHYQIPELHKTVSSRFTTYPNIKVVRGFLPDALDNIAPEKIAFLHVDLNSPAAEIGCLNLLFDRVVPGGMIVLDDYGWIDFAPQKQAEDAFFQERGYRVLELPTGQGLVVKR